MRYSEIVENAGAPLTVDVVITVVVTEAELSQSVAALASRGLVLESIWRPSAEKGLYVRVDPANPSIKGLRHVHVAHQKHLSAKGEQVAWNDDGSRHDKKSFNDKYGSQHSYRRAALAALGNPNLTLEWSNSANKLRVLIESVVGQTRRPVLWSQRVRALRQ